MATTYDPKARIDIEVREQEYRRTAKGRSLMARIYQPKGHGPFPVLLDLHGGAWNNKNRLANETMDRAVAASGVLVVAIDLTLAGESPYPASVQDANYGVRWLRWKSPLWMGDPDTIGILGSSTGGHVAELVAMKPTDLLYNALTLKGASRIEASVAYVAARSPISDPFARFKQAEKMKRAEMMQNTKNWFKPWDAVFAANPQQILDRKEKVSLPPLLIMQGSLDDNVLPSLQQKFAASYRAAGGECQLEIFEGCEHLWVDKPGPMTDRAHEMVRQFIARSLGKLRRAA